MKKLFSLFCAIFLVSWTAMAQSHTITGKVTYIGDNEPLVGVTVMPVGSGQGVSTDLDGNYSIKVGPNVKKLNFSYVGMVTQQHDIVAGKPLNVVMANSENQLSEVVVTAFGMKRDRKGLGYAVQDLKAEDLNTSGTTSLASAIQGKLSGVEIRQSSGAPGASSNMTIRGVRSFEGNNAPLFVIDGMPIESTPRHRAERQRHGDRRRICRPFHRHQP